jgi:hypothetical protein
MVFTVILEVLMLWPYLLSGRLVHNSHYNKALVLLVEIRPSPHMDNLVSILKGMEAAAGTNVVSTQVTSAVEVAGNFTSYH